jgi:ribosomal subunit interface protein
MKIHLQAKNIKITPPIREFVYEKIDPLEKFIDVFNGHFESPTGKERPPVNAWVEIGRQTLHHRKGPVFRAECQIELPKNSIRAEAVSDDLRSAIVEIKDELQRELKKLKEKTITKRRRPEREE